MVIVNVWSGSVIAMFTAETTNVKVPARVGVPLICPSLLSVKPFGNCPLAIDQVIGVTVTLAGVGFGLRFCWAVTPQHGQARTGTGNVYRGLCSLSSLPTLVRLGDTWCHLGAAQGLVRQLESRRVRAVIHRVVGFGYQDWLFHRRHDDVDSAAHLDHNITDNRKPCGTVVSPGLVGCCLGVPGGC